MEKYFIRITEEVTKEMAVEEAKRRGYKYFTTFCNEYKPLLLTLDSQGDFYFGNEDEVRIKTLLKDGYSELVFKNNTFNVKGGMRKYFIVVEGMIKDSSAFTEAENRGYKFRYKDNTKYKDEKHGLILKEAGYFYWSRMNDDIIKKLKKDGYSRITTFGLEDHIDEPEAKKLCKVENKEINEVTLQNNSQYMIIVMGRSSPTKIHYSLLEANKEAERLCRKENKETRVVQLVSGYKPQVKHFIF